MGFHLLNKVDHLEELKVQRMVIPSDTPVSVAGGSITSKSFNPLNTSVAWSPLPAPSTGWQTPASSYNTFMLLSVEYNDFTYAPMTRPWQIHFTFRRDGAYQDSGTVGENQRRGVKLCSDLNNAGDGCLPVNKTPDLTKSNIYLFPLNSGFNDSIDKAAVDDTQPNGLPPADPPYHRVEFHAGGTCNHCDHISDVILKQFVSGQVSSCRVKCTNSQCMVYTYNSPAPGPNPIIWGDGNKCSLSPPQ
jgi:hypothetical protein